MVDDSDLTIRRIAAQQTPVGRFSEFGSRLGGRPGEYNAVAGVIADSIEAALPEGGQ